jgi:uncharacterized protein (TIGR03067 family)
MTYLGLLIAVITFTTGALAQESKDATGSAVLQGTWLITSINGQTIADQGPPLTLTFTGEKYHQTLGTEVNERGTIKVDATKKPMTIDLVITEGDDAGKTQLGIIEVTGDTIRANLDRPGAGQRPSDFAVKDGGIMFEGKRKPS